MQKFVKFFRSRLVNFSFFVALERYVLVSMVLQVQLQFIRFSQNMFWLVELVEFRRRRCCFENLRLEQGSCRNIVFEEKEDWFVIIRFCYYRFSVQVEFLCIGQVFFRVYVFVLGVYLVVFCFEYFICNVDVLRFVFSGEIKSRGRIFILYKFKFKVRIGRYIDQGFFS